MRKLESAFKLDLEGNFFKILPVFETSESLSSSAVESSSVLTSDSSVYIHIRVVPRREVSL
ncbi:hypothetical protein HDU76_010367, partial [Blyttiomyces sp. JEL0837]